MPLPTGTISMANVNVELGRSSTATISLNETAVRTLAGKASGTISMNDLRGKSAITFTPASGTALSSTGQTAASVGVASSAAVTFAHTVTTVSFGTVSAIANSTAIDVFLDSETYWEDLNMNGMVDFDETGWYSASANGTITATSGGSTIGSWNWSLSTTGQEPGSGGI